MYKNPSKSGQWPRPTYKSRCHGCMLNEAVEGSSSTVQILFSARHSFFQLATTFHFSALHEDVSEN
jgi:hypothetical protein